MPKKLVNIHPQGYPIRALNTIIRSDVMGAELEVEDIRKIILEKGAVREIMPNGATVPLNLSNYANMNLYDDILKKEEEERARIEQEKIEAKKRQDEIAKLNSNRNKEIEDLINRRKTAKVEAEEKAKAKQETTPVEPAVTKVENKVDYNAISNRDIKKDVKEISNKIEQNKKKK